MINGTLSGECKTSISSSNEISSDFIVLIRKPMMRNLFISAAFIEFSCRFSFMLGVLLDIRVALFMSRWLLNIRKVFFFLLLCVFTTTTVFVCNRLAVNRRRENLLAVGPVRLMACVSENNRNAPNVYESRPQGFASSSFPFQNVCSQRMTHEPERR